MTMNNMIFNGINGATGRYLLPELTVEIISKIARGEKIDPKELEQIKFRNRASNEIKLGLIEGVDPKKLAETGWGIIFAFDDIEIIDSWREAPC